MSQDTKDRILDAGERLFARDGFADTSMRALTSAAGVNLAAANYHFGSKEGVLRAVLTRRLEPINAARLRDLDRLEARADDDGPAPRLEEILAVFVEPALGLAQSPAGRAYLQLLGRIHGDPNQQRSKEVLFEFYVEVRDRFLAALGRAVPELPITELYWRFLFLVGSMAHTMTCANDLDWLSKGAVHARDAKSTAARLVAFTAAGFRAPVLHSEP